MVEQVDAEVANCYHDRYSCKNDDLSLVVPKKMTLSSVSTENKIKYKILHAQI